ncbi:YciE/YciF ferroxidase family protein [Microseira wollei]|uniref:Ferritin-like metal-binding protein YciE n=1 Tax=Microseira wollei NIES-4236 TaxID=2530354 RepID=A0AAV3XB73_9CYAN|nr:DUF892 family protein [Microseira wollei]GET40127.1 protein of unknown function DUF892 [Microseira wollei NIES-4236]
MVSVNEVATTGTIKSLPEKFMYELGSIYDAEHVFREGIQVALPLVKNEQVKSLLEKHIKQTDQQIKNLEQVFNTMGHEPIRIPCEAAAGLFADGEKLVAAIDNPAVMDVAIAGAQTKVEHLEIASYRGLITGAQQMNQTEIVDLLQQNLQQEEQTAQTFEQCLPQLLEQAMSAGNGSR